MGNGLRLRVTQNEGHKPKTRKGNQTMKNRNIQFKPTAGFRSRCSSPALRQCLSRHPLRQQPARWCRSTALSRGTLTLSPARVRAFRTRDRFRTREPIGSLHWDGGILRTLARPIRIFVKITIPTLAPLTGLRPTATKSTALSRGSCARQKPRECTTTMKPRR